MTCHTVPQFGCISCIDSDREAWAKKAFDAFIKTHTPKTCPCCKNSLKSDPSYPYGKHDDGTWHARFVCMDIDCVSKNGDVGEYSVVIA